MRSLTLFSNKKDPMKSANEIIDQARENLNFKPDLAFFYATLKYNGKYQTMLDIFHDEYGDIPQIGASVDGMIFPDDMRTDGAALTLCEDKNAKIRVEGINQNGALGSAQNLAEKISCENGALVLHFPLVHVPGTLKSAEFFAKGFYYSRMCKSTDPDKQKEYARKFSEYCDRENIFYLPPTILGIFAEKTKYKVPIIGINLMHTQVRFDTPSIFCNFEDIGGGIAALSIETPHLNAVFDDIFPDKGNTFQETKNIVRGEFTIIKEFEAFFEKNILLSLDGKPPLHAVKDLIYVSGDKKDDLVAHLDKGDYKLQMPYVLLFFNKKTNGAFLLGIGNYMPFDIFPFYMDVSDYSNEVALAYETVDNKFEGFISCLKNLKFKDGSFVYFCIDIGAASAFGEKVFEYRDMARKMAGENYLGIMAPHPSAYIPAEFKLRNYLSESSLSTFFMSAGTNTCLEV